MPNAAIEVRRQYSRDEEVAIIDAAHAAMIESLKIPIWDKTIRLIVHEPHRFAAPPNIGDRYTLVNIDLFTGRSLGAKKALYRALVKHLEPLGIPGDHIKVCLREIPRENWGMRGGLAASEIDLGYEVTV
jgi:phenylpyruvate tautomerase PptA (4-oxalocrotonate tautomerase family)